MTKIEAAQKLVKLISLSIGGSTQGEREAANARIKDVCNTYHLRIDGVNIIDTDIEAENKRKLFDQLHNKKPILQDTATINPEDTGLYVVYKGRKYYHKKGFTGGAVPKYVYQKRYLT